MSIVDASDKGYWSAMTLQFVKDNLTDETEVLDLTGNHINVETAEIIASFLKKPESKLHALSIAQTRLNISASTIIFSAIGESQLHELVGDDNIFNAEVCQVLATSLQKGPPIELLSLCGCDIPTDGFVSISNSIPFCQSLHHLRMESNSAFSPGAKALADVIPRSNLLTLSIADNQIWADGIAALLKSIQTTIQSPNHIVSLDISYNIVEQHDLTEFIKVSQISELAISGIKIDDQGATLVLDAVMKSRLHTLIFDGYNPQVLPVSWPRAQDNIFTNPANFKYLQQILLSCSTIVDLRFGFLSLHQIHDLMTMRFDRALTICLHNFGKTENCWVLHFNQGTPFSLEAPSRTFQWKDEIAMEDVSTLAELIKITTCAGNPIDVLDLSQIPAATKSNHSVIASLIAQLGGFGLKLLNLNGLNIDSSTLNALISILPNTSISNIDAAGSQANEESFCKLLEYYIDNPQSTPKTLNIGFTSSDTSEMSSHRYADLLKTLFDTNDCPLEELTLSGPISGNDAGIFCQGIAHNEKLRTLRLLSDFIQAYKSPDPELNEQISLTFVQLVATLHEQICGAGSVSPLAVFQFPLLTEVFLYREENYKLWQEIDQKIEQNRDAIA